MLKKALEGKSAQKSDFKRIQTIILLNKLLKKGEFTQKSKFAQKSGSEKFLILKSNKNR